MDNFDLSNLATSLADEGVEMQVQHPVTGEPIDGMYIKLAGVDSEPYRKAEREMRSRHLRRMQQGRNKQWTPEEMDRENVMLLSAVTLGWRGFRKDGQEYAYSPDNVRDLYSNPLYKWLVKQVEDFVNDRAVFIKA